MSRLERDLVAAVTGSARDRAADAAATVLRNRDWSSSLFNGARLTVEISAEENEAFETWLAGLPEAEFPVRDHFVASADLIERREGVAIIDFLLVEES